MRVCVVVAKGSPTVVMVTRKTRSGTPHPDPAGQVSQSGDTTMGAQRPLLATRHIISQLRSRIIMIKTLHGSSLKVSSLFQDRVHSNNSPATRQKDVHRAAAEALSLAGVPPTNSKALWQWEHNARLCVVRRVLQWCSVELFAPAPLVNISLRWERLSELLPPASRTS